jgi:hypothetical protein
MKQIPLSRGLFALVDDEDYEELAQVSWYAEGSYAKRVLPQDSETGRCPREHMHRQIMRLDRTDPRVVDHVDGNPLNNQRSNLRICTHAENMRNTRLRSDSTTGLKGVQKFGDIWRARIQVDGKRLELGSFDTPEAAHAAYCNAAQRYHGEFANFGASASPSREGGVGRFGKPNRTGFSGVSQRGQNRWRARLRHGGEDVSLGEFSSPKAAYATYLKASSEIRGDFDARTGAALMRALDTIIEYSQREAS